HQPPRGPGRSNQFEERLRGKVLHHPSHHHPPSTGPSLETLAAASSGTKSRFKFMETPGLKLQ
ncbi:hypothetical protein PIB30_115824, partial [Stylosanthes scabra]|nr:hypothetical protein [Stylosanthes scabra]